ncbi:phosphoribosylformylglycinamidine synthase subunit PurL [Candidatus Bathyarchaeota archaeon]|nr:phosphoribosylformylglycinamidine synthase subunit PurL [Candidatus Bathyarchaeota archaeon]MBT6604306.1 phosphoribosylformylglycinamidine synthase subunit PurL [Candidatus Bathyarchaeota archaeon]
MSRVTESSLPFSHHLVDLMNATDEELIEIKETLGLGLSLDELHYIRDHYVLSERKATDFELQTFDQTMSEHCGHKTFAGIIDTPEGRINGLLKTYFKSLIDELKPDWCFSVFEDNAGLVDFTDDVTIAIKVETHNHPSAIEPFGGAATGLGGVIRDILGVWANPIANTDVLCFGPLDYPFEKLPPGVKHPSYLFKGVVDGIGSYGNSIGIPTVNGATVFDESYTGNVLVYAGCIGVLPKDQYKRGIKAGDYCVLAGGRTGFDGIHGVTFASLELSEESEDTSRSAVQVANPIEEEKVKRAIKQISDQKLGSGITDIGGGGLSCGVCETADTYGLGVDAYLDRVQLKAEDIAPWEIWISESQERMLMAVPPENLEKVKAIFDAEQVEVTVLGTYNESRHAKIYYQDELVGDLVLESLFNPPKLHRTTNWKPEVMLDPEIPEPEDVGGVLKKLLASYQICSKEKVIRRYDQEVKGQTVVKPLQGWNAGPSDASVIKPLHDNWKGISVASGINPKYGKIDPYWMAASVIDEAIRNSVCVGGRRWALLDNFAWGNPEYEDRLGSLVYACRACYDVAKIYKTPFVSGKDSLYNESPLGPVAPTLLITSLGILPDIRKAITMELKEAGNALYLVGVTKPEIGGSEYLHLRGELGGSVPKLDAETNLKAYHRLLDAMDAGLVRACHDCSEGGLGVAVAEMAFTGGLGVDLDLSNVPVSENMRDDILLFSESNGRLLVEIPVGKITEFETAMEGSAVSCVGVIKSEEKLTVTKDGKPVFEETLEELMGAWKTPLEAKR